jgi:hypothetical protein
MQFYRFYRIKLLTIDICQFIVRFRILNTVYRGHIKNSGLYLARALKIIVHANYIHTRAHPQRMHMPLQLDLSYISDVEAPLNPVLGTGMSADDFNKGHHVKVWHLRDWWHGTITYKTRAGTFNVRWYKSRDTQTGVEAHHMKIWDKID